MPKRTTAEMLELDIRELDAEGYTTPGAVGHWQWRRGEEQIANILVACEKKGRLWLRYTTGGSEDHNYPVRLDWTEPHFGGERPWFLCPEKGCGRRCAILYGPAVFACRECHDLAYPRENISGSRWQVARHRLRKLADPLEAESIGGPMGYPRTPIRPKGMHRETYKDLLHKYREAYDEHERAVTADMLKVIEACGGDVDLSDEERELLEDDDGT
jgi:hypothetical protein